MPATVWVVDDEFEVRDVLGAMLTQLGYHVRLFENGESAVQSYGGEKPDVVVTDLRMPGMSGIELTSALLRKDPQAVVMILTGFPSVPDAVEAVRQGAVDFISKPCSIGELNIRIERALNVRRLEDRLKRTRQVAWALVETLPLWIILGMLLHRFLR